MKLRTALLVGIVGSLVAAPALVAQQAPQFRAAANWVRVEASVLDDNRVPIRGLQAEDFSVVVDGRERPVLAAVEMDVASTAADPFPESARAVFSNVERPARLFVIAMNDAVGSNDPFLRAEGKRIAHRIVDGMLEGDRAAVVFYRDNRHAQDFTSDKSALRAAIERFEPMRAFIGAGLVVRAVEVLARLDGYRRAVFYIGAVGLTRFGTAAENRSPVPVYIFNTSGLRAPRSRDVVAGRTGNLGADLNDDDSLGVARATGGRAILRNNSPAGEVPGVLAELSSYYILAFEAVAGEAPPRHIEVKVRRQGAQVGPIGMQRQRAPVMRSELLEALESPIPTGNLELTLAPVAHAPAPRRNAEVVFTLGLPPVPVGVTETYHVDVFVYDGEGRREIGRERRDVNVRGDNRSIEVAMRTAAQRGRNNLRIYVERASDRASGSVFAPVTVPSPADSVLALSGVAIGIQGRVVAGRDALADVLPFAPTAVRTFTPSDRVGALWRVYVARGTEGGSQTLSILDAMGTTVWTRQMPLSAEAATPTGQEHRLDLPLSGLAVGDYLLRIEVTHGRERAQRDVRFSVAGPPKLQP